MPPISRTAIVIVIVALLLLGAAAFLLFGEDARGTAITAENVGPASGAEQVFITLTGKIDPVELDTSILEDERFKRLQDIRTPIIPEASGRIDPFAPLGGTGGAK